MNDMERNLIVMIVALLPPFGLRAASNKAFRKQWTRRDVVECLLISVCASFITYLIVRWR